MKEKVFFYKGKVDHLISRLNKFPIDSDEEENDKQETIIKLENISKDLNILLQTNIVNPEEVENLFKEIDELNSMIINIIGE